MNAKNADSFKTKTRQGTNVALKAHAEIVVIETHDVLVDLGELPNLSENFRPKSKTLEHCPTKEPGADMYNKWQPDLGMKEVQNLF